MEWNWNLSMGFRQAVSETISVGAGLFTPVGSTVDIPKATYTNTINDAEA